MGLAAKGTTWAPLGPQTEARMTGHDVICLHTMVGTLAGTDNYFRQRGYGGTESHLGTGGDGTVLQWQDLMHEADANNQGNDRIISIENSDRGEGYFPIWSGSDVPAFSNPQINSLVTLIDQMCKKEFHSGCPSTWACHREGIPRRIVSSSCKDQRGIGWHRIGVDPWRKPGCESWSEAYGKVCPGDRRINQIKNVIMPRVIKLGQGVEPTPEPEDDAEMRMTVIAPKRKPTDRWVAMGLFKQDLVSAKVADIYQYVCGQENAIVVDDDWFDSLLDVNTLVK